MGTLKAEEAAILNKVVGEGLDGKVTTETGSQMVGVRHEEAGVGQHSGKRQSGAAGVCEGRRPAWPEPRAGGRAQGEVRGRAGCYRTQFILSGFGREEMTSVFHCNRMAVAAGTQEGGRQSWEQGQQL